MSEKSALKKKISGRPIEGHFKQTCLSNTIPGYFKYHYKKP